MSSNGFVNADGNTAIPFAGGASGPSSANSVFSTNLVFDNSGWNVAFSGSKVDSAASKTNDLSAPTQDYGGGIQDYYGYLPYVAIAAGFLVLWRLAKK